MKPEREALQRARPEHVPVAGVLVDPAQPPGRRGEDDRPNAISARPSIRRISCEAIGIEIAVAIAPGSSAMPVCVALKPSTFWKNSGRISAVPYRPKPVTMPSTLPALNERERNAVRSTSGRGSRSSLKTNATSEATATTRQDHDRRGREPVLALAAFEHVLQRGDAGGEQAQADEVDRRGVALDVRLVADVAQRHHERDDPDRDVDVEDQRPGVVVDDHAAQRRPDRRADHRAQAEDRHRAGPLLGRVGLEQDRLRGRLQRPAAEALDHAVEDEHPDAGGGAAQERRDGEDHQARSRRSCAARSARSASR